MILLGVVAIATTVQAVALVRVLLAVRRLEGRLGEAERELRALSPRLERLGRVIDHVTDWTDAVARFGAMMLVKPLRPLGAALALWRGLKSGVHAYRQLGPAGGQEAPPRTSIR